MLHKFPSEKYSFLENHPKFQNLKFIEPLNFIKPLLDRRMMLELINVALSSDKIGVLDVFSVPKIFDASLLRRENFEEYPIIIKSISSASTKESHHMLVTWNINSYRGMLSTCVITSFIQFHHGIFFKVCLR